MVRVVRLAVGDDGDLLRRDDRDRQAVATDRLGAGDRQAGLLAAHAEGEQGAVDRRRGRADLTGLAVHRHREGAAVADGDGVAVGERGVDGGDDDVALT